MMVANQALLVYNVVVYTFSSRVSVVDTTKKASNSAAQYTAEEWGAGMITLARSM
jgi:hypothetical protein